MKKSIFSLLGSGLLLCFGAASLPAQDESHTTVTITITEDDVVTTDTAFTQKEGHEDRK